MRSAAVLPGGLPVSGFLTGSDDREEDAVINFMVEGGFAHQLQTLQIEADGDTVAVVSGRRSSGHLTAEKVSAIVGELDRSGVFTEDRTYPSPPGADLRRYQVGYAGVTVVAYDTAVPADLAKAIQLLQSALRATQAG